MSYEKINPIQQFNFQINRVLTYGEIACDVDLVREKTAKISNVDEWQEVWTDLGRTAEEKMEFLRAAYCFRMAEFFMKATNAAKNYLYEKCISYFYKAFDLELHLSYKRYVLLLAGEKDHYIPSQQFFRLKKAITHAHSLTCRMFTEKEGGEQHCQIGNHMIAANYIIDWLNRYFAENR